MRWLLGMVLGMGLVLGHEARGEEYLTVKAPELKANPQNYWARGIVFTDRLQGYASDISVKLGGRRYHVFKTEVLGDCYVDAELMGKLKDVELGKRLAFTGTVYQRDKGWFSSKRQFFIAVNQFDVAVDDLAEKISSLRDSFGQSKVLSPYADTLRILNDILTDAQGELAAACAASNLEVRAVFQPGSTSTTLGYHAARQAMLRKEIETKTPSLEYFVSLLTALLAVHNGGLEPVATESPVLPVEPVLDETNAPLVEAVTTEAPVEPGPAGKSIPSN